MARSLTVLLFLVLATSAAAAPPANDNRAGAIAFNGAATLGTTLEATGEAGEPQPTVNTLASRCAAQTDAADCMRTVWYDFQPAAGSWVVETCDRGTDMNTLLGIYTSDMSNALTKIASNTQGTNCPGGTAENGSRVTFSADGTTTYRIQVAGRLGSAGLFYLRAYPAPAATYATADTLIERYQSFAIAKAVGANTDGVQSGGRRTASFSFSATANGDFTTNATYQCAMNAGAFAACTSPVSYDGLAAGSHDFSVRATAGGNTDATPAVQRFTIDTTPPDTTLRSGPSGNTTAELSYTVNGSENIDSLPWGRCGFDSQPLLPCNFSNTSNLVSGCLAAHNFTAAATDQAGYLDATPLVVTATRTNNGLNCAAPTLSGNTGSAVVTGGGASVSYDAKGYGATLRMDYGTTASYGLSKSIAVSNGGLGAISVFYLEPSTTYHYKFTITSPGGTASTADDTFATGAVATTRDGITAGTPVAIGEHALRIPVHVTVPAGEHPIFGVFADDSGSPAQETSARIESPDQADATGDYVVEVVDLNPAVDYSFRAFVEGTTTMATAPFTFTMPGTAQATVTPTASATGTATGTATATGTPTATGTATTSPTATATSTPMAFKLAASNVRVKKLKHSSKAITITISGAPAGTTVKAKAKGYGKATGTTKLKIKLNKKARKKLHKRKTKTVKIKLTATPPGGTASSVTVKAKLKR